MHCWWWPALHFWLLCIQICHCWSCMPPRFHLQFILHMFLFLFQLEMVSVPKGLLDWFILEFVRFKPRKRTIATHAIRQKSGQPICLMKLKASTRVYETERQLSLGAQIKYRVLMKLGYLHLSAFGIGSNAFLLFFFAERRLLRHKSCWAGIGAGVDV